MKKLLFLSLFILASFETFAQESVVPFTFPVVDNNVIYADTAVAPGKDALDLYTASTKWYQKTFTNPDNEVTNNNVMDTKLKAKVITDIDGVFYMKFDLLVDCKDGRYVCVISNIRHTVKGKENTPFFVKYLVNVPAEKDNEIFLTPKKGYNKSQRGQIQDRMRAMDALFKSYFASLRQEAKK